MINEAFAADYPMLQELAAAASCMSNVWSVTKKVVLDYLVQSVGIAHPGLDPKEVKRYLGQAMEINEYMYAED